MGEEEDDARWTEALTEAMTEDDPRWVAALGANLTAHHSPEIYHRNGQLFVMVDGMEWRLEATVPAIEALKPIELTPEDLEPEEPSWTLWDHLRDD